MKSIKTTAPELVISLCLILFLFSSIVRSSMLMLQHSVNTLMRYSDYIVVLGLAGSFLVKSYSKIRVKKSLLFLILCFLVVIIPRFNGTLSATVLMIMFILCGANIRFEKVYYIFIYEMAILLTTVFLMSKTGILPNVIIDADRGRKECLGFTYSTILPNFFFHVILFWYSRKETEIRVPNCMIILLINAVLYKLTYTRAVFFELMLFLFFLIIEKKFPKLFSSKLVRAAFTCSMPLFATAIFLLSFYYTNRNKILLFLNNLLSDRLILGKRAIAMFGIHPFGTKVEWNVSIGEGMSGAGEYMYVDSSYLNGLLTYGYIFMFIILLGFSLMSLVKHKEGDYKFCICLLFLAVHSFSDPQLLSVKYDPFLIVLGISFFGKKINKLSIQQITDFLFRSKHGKAKIIKA